MNKNIGMSQYRMVITKDNEYRFKGSYQPNNNRNNFNGINNFDDSNCPHCRILNQKIKKQNNVLHTEKIKNKQLMEYIKVMNNKMLDLIKQSKQMESSLKEAGVYLSKKIKYPQVGFVVDTMGNMGEGN